MISAWWLLLLLPVAWGAFIAGTLFIAGRRWMLRARAEALAERDAARAALANLAGYLHNMHAGDFNRCAHDFCASARRALGAA